MKRNIFALDAFTFGHEATREFIRRQGWIDAECELVFCGNHPSVLKRLTDGASFAVVPVHNSVIREIASVTNNISRLREAGYELEERDRFDLAVSHCLLAQRHVKRAEDLERVMSKEEATNQCGTFLASVGITPDKWIKRDSTGNAAKTVSRLGANERIGAIAPKSAAIAYDLAILAEDIQDVRDNKTTFVLLENQARVHSVRVGIIGINGRFGRTLGSFYKGLGCDVFGSDLELPTGLSNEDVVKKADVVIFSVPITETPEVIRSVLPFVSDDQLLMDVTTIKQPAMNAMLESKANVVGLHPMFRPDVPFDGQTIVFCPARLSNPGWKTWVVNMLAATKTTIKLSEAEIHDDYMLTVQVNPHLANLTSALLIMESGVSVSESMAFTSPFYRVMFSLMGRLVSQNARLYTSIVMENPKTVAMLEHRIAIEQRLAEMIRNRDRAEFEKLFTDANSYFGPEITKEANELFTRIISVMNTLYGQNSIILEFSKVNSWPGLLTRVAEVFSSRNVNLNGFNTVVLDGNRIQFTISFEQSRSSLGVRQALEEIEAWTDMRVKVVE